jgi:hypothetical protein
MGVGLSGAEFGGGALYVGAAGVPGVIVVPTGGV